jgi:type 1 glutamine amidotransferase
MCRRLTLAVAALVSLAAAAPAEPPKKLLLLFQQPDGHPPATHEYEAGVKLLAKLLKPVPGLEVTVARADSPWKEGPELLGRADGAVLFLSEGARWMQSDAERWKAFTQLGQRGGSLVVLHWAMGVRDAQYVEGCVNLLGGCHGGPDRKYQVLETDLKLVEPRHPITAGIEAFRVHEEFYYRLKFPPAKMGWQPVLQAAIDGKDETVAWAWQRPDGGRSFGFSGLHFHENWRLPAYRRLVVQGTLWSLKLPIPKDGLAVDVAEHDLKIK